jgi:hypothetical protein
MEGPGTHLIHSAKRYPQFLGELGSCASALAANGLIPFLD